MSEEATRNFKQYIEVNITFDEYQEPDYLWGALHERGIAFKTYANATYEATNFETHGTRTVHYLATTHLPTGERLIHRLPTVFGQFEKNLLRDLNIDYEHYKETEETQKTERFEPASFAFSNDAIANFPFIEAWYSHQAKSGWADDLRWQPDVDAIRYEADFVNILGFSCRSEFNGSVISGLTMRMYLTTSGPNLLDDSEKDTDSILEYITTHVNEVASCELVFGCHGEIEVEKQVSCARFVTED